MSPLHLFGKLLGGSREKEQEHKKEESVGKRKQKHISAITNARYIRLSAGGRNVMCLNTCEVTQADADRIAEMMFDEEYDAEIDEGTFLANYFDRAGAESKGYNVINIWNENDRSIYDSAEIHCEILDADGNVIDEGPIPLSDESACHIQTVMPPHQPRHLLVSGYNVEEATMTFECPADIDVSQIRFMAGIRMSPCGEWLSPDMIIWDSVIYKGEPLRQVDSAEGDSEDFYYALLDLENKDGKPSYSLVEECSTELS